MGSVSARGHLILFFLVLLGTGKELCGQCTSSAFLSSGSGDLIRLSGIGLGNAQLEQAAGYWAACPGYGRGFPKFTTDNVSAALQVTVDYRGGDGESCGTTLHLSPTQIVITLWDRGHTTTRELYNCNVIDTLAHELGHVLDFNNSGCSGYIMGDGLLTTSVLWEPVRFDINGDGLMDSTGWLNPYSSEGFLWIDLNRNGAVDSARELFGDATLLPNGENAKDGFEALASYDQPELGGNGDGAIDPDDLVWPFLRIWGDRNFDGRSQRDEIRPLAAWKIVRLSLTYTISDRVDGSSNLHRLLGTYVIRREGENGSELRERALEDVYFRASLGTR